jgi:inhibitor of growth protein 3
MDSADADDDGADDTKYCYCQRVSYGDMVACDNADCKNQWFHWECAGLVAEPVGDWLCRDCAKLPKSKIKKA